MDLAEGNWLIVAGYFDPLTAALAHRLRGLVDQGRKEKVAAVVLDNSETLLTAEARSLLVAALRTVDAVLVMSEEHLNDFIPLDERIRFVFDREAERRNSAEFAAMVLGKERQRLQSGELGS
jgi:hypothetical protein